MAGPGLFVYLRHKIIVSVMRTLMRVALFLPSRREHRLSQTYGTKTQQIQIPSRDKNRKIKAYLHHPSQDSTSPSASSATAATPILINWHGSGFVLPMLGSDCVYCARIAKESGIFVLDADYRKAPENPFPAAVEDVEDVLNWVATQTDRFDTNRVAVSGFSAGGNLALVAASALRKASDINIRAAISIYPVTDISLEPESKTVPHPVKPIPSRMAHLFNDCYVPDKPTRKDPRVSPSYANVEEFPETVMIATCEGDSLSPEADSLAQKLDDGTRKVVHLNLKGMPHGFDKGVKEGSKEWDRREEVYSLAVKTLKERLCA